MLRTSRTAGPALAALCLLPFLDGAAGPANAGDPPSPASAQAPAQAPAAPAAPEPPSRAAVAAPPELAAARAQLLEIVRRGMAPSLAVGVIQGGKVVWEEALGWADREAGIPATPETRYGIASVSKTITATGAVALAAEGRMKLDQTVASILGPGWLPGAEGSPSEIRVSQLISHRSGLPPLWFCEYAGRPDSFAGREALIREHGFLAVPPGERYLFSNLGYGLLGQVLEKVGGAPLQQVLARALLAPLGMLHTTSETWFGAEGTVRGYDKEGKPIPHRYRFGPDAASGYFSSVHDLLRYAQFHLGTLAVTGSLRAAALSSGLGDLPAGEHYVRAWGVVKLPQGTVLVSDGEVAGGIVVVMLVPERQLATVVLSNQTGGPATGGTAAIVKVLLPEILAPLGAAMGAIRKETLAPGTVPTGRFAGSLRAGKEEVPVKLDFRQADAPAVELGPFRGVLQSLNWNGGAFQGSVGGALPFGVDRTRVRKLTFSLWPKEGGLEGYALEELEEDRPRYGLPHRVRLKPAP